MVFGDHIDPLTLQKLVNLRLICVTLCSLFCDRFTRRNLEVLIILLPLLLHNLISLLVFVLPLLNYSAVLGLLGDDILQEHILRLRRRRSHQDLGRPLVSRA